MNTPATLHAVELAQQRVLGWQTKLHRWAAEDEQARFGDLFNLLCNPATLMVAWERVKQNRGSKTAGVDGGTRRRIEQLGWRAVLGELRQALRHVAAPMTSSFATSSMNRSVARSILPTEDRQRNDPRVLDPGPNTPRTTISPQRAGGVAAKAPRARARPHVRAAT